MKMMGDVILREIGWRHILLCQRCHHRTSAVVRIISDTIEWECWRWGTIAARERRGYAATPCGVSIFSAVAVGGVCGVGGDGGDASVGVVDTKEDVAVAGAAPDAAGFVA